MVTVLGNITPLASDYSEIARSPLEAERCALLVIDIQEKLLPPIFQKAQLVKNSQLLIRLARILKLPALVSTQYARDWAILYRKSLLSCRKPRPSINKCFPVLAAMLFALC